MLDIKEIDEIILKTKVLKFNSKKKIVFFCTSPWWINYMYYIASVLSKSGCKVYFYWTNSSEFDNLKLKEWKKYYNNLKKHKNNFFPIYQLDKEKAKKSKLSNKEIQNLYTDCYYFYKKKRYLNEKNNFFLNRKNIFLNSKIKSYKVIKNIRPDHCIIHGGEYGETRAFLTAARENKIDCCVIESFTRNISNPIRYLWNFPTLKTDGNNVKKSWNRYKKYYQKLNFPEKSNFDRIKKITNHQSSFQIIQTFRKTESKLLHHIKKNKLKKILITTSYNFESHNRLKNNFFLNQNIWFKNLMDRLAKYNNIYVYLNWKIFKIII